MVIFYMKLVFYLSITACLGGLSIVSPDEIQQEIISYATASFGNPGYYPIFGELMLITATSCSFAIPLGSYSIGLVYLNSTSPCSYSALALNIQNSGGIGVIFVLEDENLNYSLPPANDIEGMAVQILVLGIPLSLGEVILSQSDKQIWITYSYGVVPSNNVVIEYYLTSNYSLDQRFFTALEKLNSDITLARSELQIGFINEIYALANTSTDCISYYCVSSSGAVTGAQKLNNSIVIMNYYNALTDGNSVIDAINLLLDLYSSCQNDYSTKCLYSTFTRHQATPDTSTEVLSGLSITDNSSDIYFEISNVLFTNLQGLESAFCLSSENPNPNCLACSESCPYNALDQKICSDGCNTTNCGYDFLLCLEISINCYSFMLGDNNCNRACANDPDCRGTDHSIDKMTLITIIVPVIVGILL